MHEKFEQLVEQAIDNIPSPYSDKLQNVVFKVEEKPSYEQRAKLGMRPCDALFGLYEGVPLTKRGGATHSIVPDVITIFMYPMVDLLPEIKKLKKQVYETVWHEVAHYYGLDHDQIHKAKTNKSR